MRGAGSWRTVPGSLPGLAPEDLPPLRLLRHPRRVKASIVRETSSSRAGWPGDLILLLPGKQNCHRGHASSRRRWSAPVPSVREPGFARPSGCSRAGPDLLESERAAPGPSCSLGAGAVRKLLVWGYGFGTPCSLGAPFSPHASSRGGRGGRTPRSPRARCARVPEARGAQRGPSALGSASLRAGRGSPPGPLRGAAQLPLLGTSRSQKPRP